jgi:maleylacetoacetate isomerase
LIDAGPRDRRGWHARAIIAGEPNGGQTMMKLFTYYRSQASFRVRIALNLKRLAHEDVFLHLERGDQFAADYRALNPQMVVPTLIDGEARLFQSLAILEYLDETHPEPPLLPRDPASRAWVRGIALINTADSHPLIVPRIRHYLSDVLKLDDTQRNVWIRHWIDAGSQAIETLLADHRESGRFCHGEAPTLADICIVTQVTPAKTFGCDLAQYPRMMRVYETCMGIAAFADAHPSKQPDAE